VPGEAAKTAGSHENISKSHKAEEQRSLNLNCL
jgi:hypothetical protein